MSIHAVRGTYDPRRPFVPWLLAIPRNRLADGGGRYSRSTAHEVQVEDLAVTFAFDSTNNNTEKYAEVEELKQAIRTLPTIQRDAIEMLKLKEMSLREAAEASHKSVGALKVATHRAMTALRTMLVKKK